MPNITPIHNVEIAYLLEELSKQNVDFSVFDEETRQFIEMINAGERANAQAMQRNLEPILGQVSDNGLGLKAGELVRVSDVGAFGHAYLSSKNLRSAHQLILSYRKILRTIHEISGTGKKMAKG